MMGERMAAAGKPEYRERIAKYHRYCRDNDLAVAVAQTDVKGDRSLGPTAQDHPDYYVRIVEERPDGIVVRGAKVHTSVSTNTNEIIVLPTRAMKAEDKAYAVAFAVPVNTPGLKLIASPHGRPQEPVRASDQRAPQDDGDADGVRRRLRAQGARVPAAAKSISRGCWR